MQHAHARRHTHTDTIVLIFPIAPAPIIGPSIGGALALKLGWRSTFVAGAIASAVVLIMGVFILKVCMCIGSPLYALLQPQLSSVAS